MCLLVCVRPYVFVREGVWSLACLLFVGVSVCVFVM